MVKTIFLNGSEVKVSGPDGDNAEIHNFGTDTVYASKFPNIAADADNVIAVSSGAIDGLSGTGGTVYLLGKGKVQVNFTDEKVTRTSVSYTSGNGLGVMQKYVDEKDADTLAAAKEYADTIGSDLSGYIGYTANDIYGLEADFENNRFTRLAGAAGKGAGKDFDSVRAYGGRRRCNLSDRGEVLAYYGDKNFKADGSNGQVMVEQPKYYYKVVPLKIEKIDSADGYHLRKARYYISDTPKAGFKIHPAFVQNGVEFEKIYLSAYEGSIYDTSAGAYLLNDEQVADFDTDKLSGIVNAKPVSGTIQALTRGNARKLAQNRGAGWGITTIQTLSATQLLFAIEYATFNSQSAIGNGVVNTTAPINTGSTSSLGNVSGSVASGGVTYRGEENLWGNMYEFVDGIFFDNPADSGYDSMMYFPGDEQKFPCYKATNKYPSTLQYISEYDWLFWGSEYNGNTAFLTGDIVWNGYTGYNLSPMTGGRWSNAQNAGLFCYSVYMSEAKKSDSCSARLIYIPQPETT